MSAWSNDALTAQCAAPTAGAPGPGVAVAPPPARPIVSSSTCAGGGGISDDLTQSEVIRANFLDHGPYLAAAVTAAPTSRPPCGRRVTQLSSTRVEATVLDNPLSSTPHQNSIALISYNKPKAGAALCNSLRQTASH